MPTISTIGYTRKSLRQFIGLLQEAGVDAVIDVRLRNTSQLAGFAKLTNVLSKGTINPLIEAAAISAFPMSARVVHRFAQEEDFSNF